MPRRRSARPIALAVMLCAVAVGPASAVPLPFQGSIAIVFGPFPIVAEFAGSGVAMVNDDTGGALTSLAIPAGAFQTTGLLFPGTGLISQIRVTALNGSGVFTGLTPSGGGGVMPLAGDVVLCLLAPCGAGFALALPLSPVGQGGSAQVTGPITVTLTGSPWTLATTTISTTFAVTILSGFAHGPLSNTGTTAQSGGLIELVTPVRVSTTIPGFDELTGYAVLQVRFVPEPGTAVLLGASLALLAAGRRRQRQGRRGKPPMP